MSLRLNPEVHAKKQLILAVNEFYSMISSFVNKMVEALKVIKNYELLTIEQSYLDQMLELIQAIVIHQIDATGYVGQNGAANITDEKTATKALENLIHWLQSDDFESCVTAFRIYISAQTIFPNVIGESLKHNVILRHPTLSQPQNLDDYLMAPVQLFPRYKITLKNILDNLSQLKGMADDVIALSEAPSRDEQQEQESANLFCIDVSIVRDALTKVGGTLDRCNSYQDSLFANSLLVGDRITRSRVVRGRAADVIEEMYIKNLFDNFSRIEPSPEVAVKDRPIKLPLLNSIVIQIYSDSNLTPLQKLAKLREILIEDKKFNECIAQIDQVNREVESVKKLLSPKERKQALIDQLVGTFGVMEESFQKLQAHFVIEGKAVDADLNSLAEKIEKLCESVQSSASDNISDINTLSPNKNQTSYLISPDKNTKKMVDVHTRVVTVKAELAAKKKSAFTSYFSKIVAHIEETKLSYLLTRRYLNVYPENHELRKSIVTTYGKYLTADLPVKLSSRVAKIKTNFDNAESNLKKIDHAFADAISFDNYLQKLYGKEGSAAQHALYPSVSAMIEVDVYAQVISLLAAKDPLEFVKVDLYKVIIYLIFISKNLIPKLAAQTDVSSKQTQNEISIIKILIDLLKDTQLGPSTILNNFIQGVQSQRAKSHGIPSLTLQGYIGHIDYLADKLHYSLLAAGYAEKRFALSISSSFFADIKVDQPSKLTSSQQLVMQKK